MKLYPALDVGSTADAVLVLVDDFSPTAVEESGDSMRLFFASADARDAACAELHANGYATLPLNVPDDDWARRSQEGLAPVTVGRVTVFPTSASQILDPARVAVVIEPSMGFGTGHHATTRLCLEALQRVDLTGAFVLDIGTGSGVLAIAADRLGAGRTLGIDCDADAVHSALRNLVLNPQATHTAFEIRDLASAPLPDADVVTANLTGALLMRAATTLLAATRRGGTLILSGMLTEERDVVRDAFGGATLTAERQETEWWCLCLAKR